MIRSVHLHNDTLMTVQAQQRRAGRVQFFWLVGILSVTLLQSYSLIRGLPILYLLAWTSFLLCIAAVLHHPRNGVYILVSFSLLGDASLAPSYPFYKNLSSRESLLFFNDSFSFTPLEIILALTLAVWVLHMAFQHKWEIRRTPLLIPVMLFAASAAFGLFYGISRGGNRVIGLWECRAIFYLFPMFLLVSNLITTRTHVKILLWAIAIPVAIDGLFGLSFVVNTLKFQLSGVESIGEHALSIQFNAFFVLLIASWVFRGSWSKRLILPIFVLPILISYVANNRRASFICLALALMVFALILFRRTPVRFWLIVPPLVAVGMVYIVVFWNAGGPIGAPAKAVRSVIGQPDPRDASSNVYRDYENINILYTIKAAPLFGLGFGHKFYRIVPLADISVFPFYEYVPHNSILWIWIKMGFVGFASMIWMIALSIAIGTRVLWHMPNDDMSVAAAFALCYVIMHFVFAYVDMSWDGPNMIMVGMSIGLISCLTAVVEHQPPLPEKRWPWQPAPHPLPGISPVRRKDNVSCVH